MSRRARAERREIAPDPQYGSEVVARFINRVMIKGKKSLARRLVYGAFDIIAERTNKPPMEIFELAMKNAAPMVEVRPRRVGGATYQVPIEVIPERRMALAIRWLVTTARSRPGKSMSQKLADELMDAANNQGETIKRKENVHRMAESNRAFAHFRW